MLDSIDINPGSRPFEGVSSATSWFDTINKGRRTSSSNNNNNNNTTTSGGVGVTAANRIKSSTSYAHANAAASPMRQSTSSYSNMYANAMELTPSTIRHNEDSTGSPRGILSTTQSPLQEVPETSNDKSITTTATTTTTQSHTSTSQTASPLLHGKSKNDNSTTSSQSRLRSRHDDLYEDAMRAQLAKRQWAAVEQMRQSMLETARVERDCPFKPRLSAYAAKIRRPAELSPQNRIYDELIRKEEWHAKKRRENVIQELQGCTFRPLTVRAATLKSSALVHDSHIFSELYDHHKEQKQFREELQPYVVEQLERHMLFKNPSNKTVSEDKINTVVERLFSRGVVVQNENAKQKQKRLLSPSFKPTVNAESERIAARQREYGQVPEDVVERLFNPSPLLQQNKYHKREEEEERKDVNLKLLQSEYDRTLRLLLQRERRKTFVSAKFDILSDAINAERRGRDGPERVKNEYLVEEITRVAILLLSPGEVEELSDILAQSNHTVKLNKENFMLLCEEAIEGLADPSTSLLGRLPPPRLTTTTTTTTGTDTAFNTDMNTQKPQYRSTLREIPSPEELERLKAKRAERRRKEAEEELQRRRAIEEEEQQQCTFRPSPRRKIPHECRADFNVEVKTTKAAALRRAYIQKTLEAEDEVSASDLPPVSRKELFRTVVLNPHVQPRRSQSVGGHSPSTQAHMHMHTKAALALPVESSPPVKTSEPKRNKYEAMNRSCSSSHAMRSHSKRRENTVAVGAAGGISDHSSEEAAVVSPSTAQPRLYRDVVSEHAAFGREGALTEFGRELILKQLREYRQRR
ncbi:uncharacterized protein TM35_000052370 [Trypanosoma theileri]|uniref:Uncharacterized protein n=1 Tax=Trypanosoma theileri TaxID=67003 RepID=A0A1X0P481_9TRYP|nr:uncharacterized protein TM35_000052370 [Trypanosoma theileri]ORC91641.1 hypothetical protein TM35_000052370 [Trypanosoma theileri]